MSDRTCPECGETARRFTRSVCKRCYLRHWRAGTHGDIPPRRRLSVAGRTEKYCPACQTVKPIDAFNVSRDRVDQRQGFCRGCSAVYRAAKQAHYRDYELRRRYDLSALEFDLLLATQAGGCAICETEVNPDGPALAVDHCHTTGRVRGILCGPCNKAIGLFRDDPLLLEKAVVYLRK